MLIFGFLLPVLYSTPTLLASHWGPPSLLSVLGRLPQLGTSPSCLKSLGWLPAFHISPRLPIVSDSPLCPPGFSFPHSPEISCSYVPGGVPQGWVACHCMSLVNFFLSPILQKAIKTSPPLPLPTATARLWWLHPRDRFQGVLVGSQDWRCSGTLIASTDGGTLEVQGTVWEAGASGGARRAPKDTEDLVLLSKGFQSN